MTTHMPSESSVAAPKSANERMVSSPVRKVRIFCPIDAASFCETVARERVSHTVLVPTMINLLTQFPNLEAFDLTSLQAVAYGGSPMSPALIRRTREVLPHVKLVQGYGLSETGFLTGLQDHEHTEDRLTSCGRPCPGVDLRVTDESGKELGPGHRGELVVRGANIMRGYWNNPEETKLTFRDGMLRTGDIGHRDADGYFFILDRVKDMIVTGGENVYSGEVEAVIYEHPAVLEAAVFGMPDPQWGELVAACDLAIAGQTARFAMPGVGIGLFCSTPLVAVARAISRRQSAPLPS